MVYIMHVFFGLVYVQVPGIDFTDNLSPLVLEVTFQIVLILMIKYSWIKEIVDVKTSFLYGDLEEEIYRKIPTITGQEYN